MARGVGLGAVRGRDFNRPVAGALVIGQALQLAAHQQAAAMVTDFFRRSIPHHAGALARILERFDQ